MAKPKKTAKKAVKKSNQIPLEVLEKRAAKLNRLIKSRSK